MGAFKLCDFIDSKCQAEIFSVSLKATEMTNKAEDLKSRAEEKYTEVKTTVLSKADSVKAHTEEKYSEIKTTFLSQVDSVKICAEAKYATVSKKSANYSV